MRSFVLASLMIAMGVGALIAETKQGKVRWRNDDGGESAATWRVMENTTDTLRSRTSIRLRLELYNSFVGGAADKWLSLHYSTDGVNFVRITDDNSKHWMMSPSASISDQEPTTDQLTNTIAHAAGGVVVDSSYNVHFNATGPASNEFEFVITPTTNAVSVTTYYFQVRDTTGGAIDLVDNNGVLVFNVGPKIVQSGSAANISPTSADLQGSVNPQGDSAWAYFEYGASTSFGQQTLEEFLGADTNDVPFGHALTGLSPHRQYFYRLVAHAGGDTTYGPNRQFFADGPPVGGGRMLFLDGTTYGSTTRMISDDMTIAMWISTSGTGVGYQHYQLMHLVTSETGGGANDFGFGIDAGGKLAFGNGDGGAEYTASSSASVNTGQWVFVAATREKSTGTIKLYINGSLDGTTNGAVTSSNANSTLRLGWSDDTPLTPFQGAIDEVSVWNTVLTQSQIRAIMHTKLAGTESGLAASWNFDDNGSMLADDATSGGYDLTLTSIEMRALSLAPTGTAGAFPESFPGTVGPVGASLEVTMTSVLDSANNIGVYSFGDPAGGFTSTGEVFAGSVVERSTVAWGIHERGSDTVDLVFDYSQVEGIADPSKIRILKRSHAADTTWEIVAHTERDDFARTILISGVTDFSEYSLGAESGALPAQMAGSVKAEVSASAPFGVTLRWTTATETDNAGWEVERRVVSRQYEVGSKEKEGWVKIGFVEGAGTSTSAREYSFTDRSIFDNRQSTIDNSPRFVYRLKQLDRSGSFSYSHEVEVEIGTAPREFTLDQNYPNPFNPTTTIEFTVPEDGRTTLKVFDLLGREVLTLLDEDLKAGIRHRALFDASALPTGVYVARLQAGGQQTIRRMSLVK